MSIKNILTTQSKREQSVRFLQCSKGILTESLYTMKLFIKLISITACFLAFAMSTIDLDIHDPEQNTFSPNTFGQKTAQISAKMIDTPKLSNCE